MVRCVRTVSDFVPTSGRWFYQRLTKGTEGAEVSTFTDAQVAFHSTSLECAVGILNKGLEIGPSVTGDKIGVYFERPRRKANSFAYATHNLFGTDGLLTAVVFEAMIDKRKGTTVNKQWVQPAGSFVLTGVYTHQFPITRLYSKGMVGSLRVHKDVFLLLRTCYAEGLDMPSRRQGNKGLDADIRNVLEDYDSGQSRQLGNDTAADFGERKYLKAKACILRGDLRFAERLDRHRQKGDKLDKYMVNILKDYDSGKLFELANDATEAFGHGRIKSVDGTHVDIGPRGQSWIFLEHWVPPLIPVSDSDTEIQFTADAAIDEEVIQPDWS